MVANIIHEQFVIIEGVCLNFQVRCCMKISLFSLGFGLFLLSSSVGCGAGTAAVTYDLPAHSDMSGVKLVDSLAKRHTTRNFDMNKPISDQVLSDLLWSAWGINRADGKRTVPTAMNKQDVELYVCKSDGVWRYIAEDNVLLQVSDKDMRVGQMTKSPLTFVYAGLNERFAGMHAGSMYQSASLCAAAYGLGDVVIYSPVEKLQGHFPVKEGYKVVVAQSFGWPAAEAKR